MKRVTLLSVLLATLPIGTMAQDDLYFTPSAHEKEAESAVIGSNGSSYYSGISKSDDEYNRRHKLNSYYQKIGEDSLGNDVIEFYTDGNTVAYDTVYAGNEQYMFDDDDDFAYSRRMARFDNFYGWYDPYYASYWYDPWYADRWAWGWSSPWYYDSLWGWPYYSSWGWRYGWAGNYWNWYPGYWGWHYPTYVWTGPAGTRNHSFARADSRPADSGRPQSSFGTGTRRGTVSNQGNNNRYNSGNNGNRSFNGSRTYDPNRSNNSSRTYTPQPSTPRSSSFGGSRSSFGGGGSFGGGSRSFGGGGSHGSFGGHRR